MFFFSFEYGMETTSWCAELAFRTRVSMSAIGSVMVMWALRPSSPGFRPLAVMPFGVCRGADLRCQRCVGLSRASPATQASRGHSGGGAPRASGYQELLVTPGSSPACAISRRQMRQRPNLRYTECGRPHFWQRVYARTLNFGFRFALLTSAVLAMSVLLEGEAELLEQRATLVIVGRRGDHGDVHAPHAVDLVLVDLVEHRLLGQTERVVATAVELLGREAPEVTDPRQGRGHETVEELPHAVATQRGVRADRHALTQLELGDRLARLGDDRLLAGDRRQVAHRAVDELGVARRLTDTHVDDDLDDAGHLHDVGEAELREECGLDLVRVALLEPRSGLLADFSHDHRSLPERTATRTRVAFWRPSRSTSSTRVLMRVGSFVSGSTTATLLTWTGASWVTRPPVRLPRPVVPALVCFVIRLMPSTSTRWVSG